MSSGLFKKPALIVILGPTASGKSELAVKLAKRFSSEIISADSRQIYKEMDIGTASPCKLQITNYKLQTCKDVPHHLFNFIKPNQNFTLAQYKRLAIKTIKEIQQRNKLPILCGGAGLYIKAVVDNLKIPKVAPDKKLRQKLEKQDLSELLKILKSKDPQAYKKIDKKNKRRIIRALEVCLIAKKPFSQLYQTDEPLFNVLQIGIKLPLEELNKKIDRRVEKMIKAGLIEEVKNLAKKYSWKLPSMSGIGYQEIGRYLRHEISLEKAKELIKLHTRQYARRQMTWFSGHGGSAPGGKKDKRIKWVKNYQKAEKLIKKFLN